MFILAPSLIGDNTLFAYGQSRILEFLYKNFGIGMVKMIKMTIFR